ncbi:Acyl-CoA dehydrogenase NM domain-like protein [Mycena sanguinolenta]|uniref:Acyl-CoA dehydrogenase NM domain-like protein n=1 Tax=Mycena sanguinolenta TaxID=230812 RepID=A0A8H7DH12_9AGAR|nr:Acyl-CoA dehydrogenase NM domain-like protein [Mycena sanguinolenta]
MRVEDIFHQPAPPNEHPYWEDPVLPSVLKRILPESVLQAIEPDLTRLGHDLVNSALGVRDTTDGLTCVIVVRPLAAQVRLPTLTHYNAWGERIDLLQTSEGWRNLKSLAVKEGYISNAYERKYHEHSRVYMFAKCMMMTGDFHVIMCPFGMTDGAARLFELFGSDKMKTEILPRLISRDPANSYLCGQWMTEVCGETLLDSRDRNALSRVQADRMFREWKRRQPLLPRHLRILAQHTCLTGFKWFSSAAEGNMSVALARTGDLASGSGALSLFVVPIRFQSFPTPLSNNIQIHRLKDKVGTHGVPTAELSLNSARGWLIGGLNEGVKTIAPMLNITRIHSAIHSIGSLQRCLSIARSYATVRTVAGGKLLESIPLHMENLANITILYAALIHFTFGAVSLLGKSECNVATREEEARLRLLTPTVKGFTALKAVTAMEECMAALGGQGYIEETGFGRLIRDAMVEKIWEGTIDVMALDLIRATRDDYTLESFCQWAAKIIALSPVKSEPLLLLQGAINQLPSLFRKTFNPLLPRSLLILLGHVASSVYLLEHAIWSRDHGEPSAMIDWDRFSRWVDEGSLKTAIYAVEVLDSETESRLKVNKAHVYRIAKL